MTELQLRYAFLPSISPLVASPSGGANPVETDLVVIVSNPNPTGTVRLYEITIDIPVGEDAAATLSADRDPFHTPDPDEVGGWKITGSGSTITLKPDDGGLGTIAGALLFKLPGIRVDTTPGTVKIRVSEQSQDFAHERKVWTTDDTTYTLVKQPNDYVITNFSLDPKVLDDIDLPVRLFWTTTDAGKNLTYKVRSEDWAPKATFQRADGITGVAGPTVDKTRTFTLDAFTTDGGSTKLAATAEATVVVEAPGISRDSRIDHSPSGRLVSLRWLATNARGVQVVLDGAVVDEAAPVDTYHSPYSLLVPADPAHHQVSLVAHAVSGDATASVTLPEFISKAPLLVPVPNCPYGLAASNECVLVAMMLDGEGTHFVRALDRRTGAVQKDIPVPAFPMSIAFIPGTPQRAFVIHLEPPGITMVDIDAGTATTLPVKGAFSSVALTPDGALALLVDLEAARIIVIDVKTLTAEQTPILLPNEGDAIAISADGRTAVVGEGRGERGQSGTLMVIDIATRRVVGEPIALARAAVGLALTPDGATALAANVEDKAVQVVDLPSRTADPHLIPLGHKPRGIATTPDGRYAITANAEAASESDPSMTVIDVARRTVCTSLDLSGAGRAPGPEVVSISPDGLCVAVLLPDSYPAGVVIF